MKKIFLRAGLILFLLASCETSLKDKQLQSLAAADVIKNPAFEDAILEGRKVMATLIAIGTHYNASASVAYVLLDDGEVLVFNDCGATAPFSKAQAKILLQAQLDEKGINAK